MFCDLHNIFTLVKLLENLVIICSVVSRGYNALRLYIIITYTLNALYPRDKTEQIIFPAKITQSADEKWLVSDDNTDMCDKVTADDPLLRVWLAGCIHGHTCRRCPRFVTFVFFICSSRFRDTTDLYVPCADVYR